MIDGLTKEYFRQRQRNRLYEDVIKAVEKAAVTNGTRRKDIADCLDVSQSQVSRWLSGPANWGVDTISDLLFAVGAELDFLVAWFDDRQKRNEFHPLGEPISKSLLPIPLKETGSLNPNRVEIPNPVIYHNQSSV